MLITGLTRYLFRSRYLYDIDSVNFALALRRFDPTVHQPHPPGYFLYVCLGRFVYSLIHDANSALVALSIGASCGAVWMIYLLTCDWFGLKAARCAGVLFVFSPLAWFHGTVALTYIVETFFAATLGWLCWKRSVVGSAAVLGLAAGFRPSSLLFLAPLLLFSLWKASWRLRLSGIAILTFVVLLWFIPMVRLSGGFGAWSSSLMSLWNTVPGRQTVLNSPIANSVARFLSILAACGLCFGCAAMLPMFRPMSLRAETTVKASRELVVFSLMWIAPGLLFFTFVFLKFVNSGYLLFLSPPVFAWLGFLASEWYKPGRRALAAACLGANCLIFLWAPVYCSYGQMRDFERQLESVVASLPRIASPRDTMIVGFDSHFMGYRHAGYYLPNYLTVEYPAVGLASGRWIFTMRDRDTKLAAEVPRGYAKFVIFPLPPEGSDYRGYMEAIRNKLGDNHLQFPLSGGNTFITGPASALSILFDAHP
jgi:hypothetical protein